MDKAIELSVEAREAMSRDPEVDWPRIASRAIESVAHALESARDEASSSDSPRTPALCQSIKRGIRRSHEAALGTGDGTGSDRGQ